MRRAISCMVSFLGMLAVHSALAQSEQGRIPHQEDAISIRAIGGWKVFESTNFRCWCKLPDDEGRQLVNCCETWRRRLRNTWNPGAETSTWNPRCEVYVHQNRDAYNSALKRPGDSSVGSTIMNFDHERTVYRRIDLRADAGDWSSSALPHELTHVVLGERFRGHAVPRWVDEGIAMLSESADKHRERLEHLQKIIATRTTSPIADIVTSNRLPSPQVRDAFYGQSLALTSFLIRKSTPARFADFVEDSRLIGVEQALQIHYSIRNLAALQREWNDWTNKPESVTFVSLRTDGETNPITLTLHHHCQLPL